MRSHPAMTVRAIEQTRKSLGNISVVVGVRVDRREADDMVYNVVCDNYCSGKCM